MDRMKDRFCLWLSWKLPKRLVKWCAVRVGAHATTGEYGHSIVPEVTFMDALERWVKPGLPPAEANSLKIV